MYAHAGYGCTIADGCYFCMSAVWSHKAFVQQGNKRELLMNLWRQCCMYNYQINSFLNGSWNSMLRHCLASHHKRVLYELKAFSDVSSGWKKFNYEKCLCDIMEAGELFTIQSARQNLIYITWAECFSRRQKAYNSFFSPFSHSWCQPAIMVRFGFSCELNISILYHQIIF